MDNLRTLAKSLSNVRNIGRHAIRIYDDASTAYDPKDIRALFPSAKSVDRNNENLGADGNLYRIMTDFLRHEEDVLFICDSDLIVHPECLNYISAHIEKTPGVMSVYNSVNHPSYGEAVGGLLRKKSIGAAGSVYTRSMVERIISELPAQYSNYWDWAISFYLTGKGVDIYVSEQSYVQHIGLMGENNTTMLFDYGVNYKPETPFEKEQLAHFYEAFFLASGSLRIGRLCYTAVRKVVSGFFRTLLLNAFGYRLTLYFLSRRKAMRQSKKRR